MTVTHTLLCLVNGCAYLSTKFSSGLWRYKHRHGSTYNCATKRKK
jgi:hypothetical protein